MLSSSTPYYAIDYCIMVAEMHFLTAKSSRNYKCLLRNRRRITIICRGNIAESDHFNSVVPGNRPRKIAVDPVPCSRPLLKVVIDALWWSLQSHWTVEVVTLYQPQLDQEYSSFRVNKKCLISQCKSNSVPGSRAFYFQTYKLYAVSSFVIKARCWYQPRSQDSEAGGLSPNQNLLPFFGAHSAPLRGTSIAVTHTLLP